MAGHIGMAEWQACLVLTNPCHPQQRGSLKHPRQVLPQPQPKHPHFALLVGSMLDAWDVSCCRKMLRSIPGEFNLIFLHLSLFPLYDRYEANLVCEDLGGFLMEPRSSEIQVALNNMLYYLHASVQTLVSSLLLELYTHVCTYAHNALICLRFCAELSLL